MKLHPVFRLVWILESVLLLASFVFLLYSLGWEYSTRQYLKGFSNAVVPETGSPEERVEAILAWMKSGPARRTADSASTADLFRDAPARDPEETLNYTSLLQVCGTATNAFVNLALSSGLQARRLLLVNSQGSANHVDAEVWLDGRWVVVDPAFRIILRDTRGTPLTREQLTDPRMLQFATQGLTNYLPSYTFERTAHVHFARIKFLGPLGEKVLNVLWPKWEGSIYITLLLERDSFAACVCACVLFIFLLLARFVLGWYASSRLGVQRMRLSERLRRGGAAFLKQVS